MLHAICKTLGLEWGSKKREPPRSRSGYLKWCEEKGIQPYPFRPPDPEK